MTQVLVLTGAGASAEAGIPTAVEMTRLIDEALRGRARNVFRYVVGGLMMARGQADVNPLDGINIEEVYSAVTLLGQRGSLEAAPFVGAWHAGVEALDRTSTKYDRLARAVVEQVLEALDKGRVSMASPRFRQEFEKAVRGTIAGGTGAVYLNTAEQMVGSLTSLVRLDDAARVAYLRPLVEYAYETHATIATLNYDTAVEATAVALSIPFSTGITGWAQSGQLGFQEDDVVVLKLHGSIPWEDRQVRKDDGAFDSVLAEHPWNGAASGKPWLVFGQRDKLQVQGPFLDLLMEFRRALAAADCLLVIGYSFRDSYVNFYIDDWLDHHDEGRVIVVDKAFPARSVTYAGRIASRLGPRLTVIDRPASEGLGEALRLV